MKSSFKYAIVYDFETGGLPSKEKLPFYNIPLVEVAAVVVDMTTLTVCEEVSMIFPYGYKEDLEYQPQATEVHGITKEIQEAKSIPLKEIHKTLVKMFSKYKNPRQGCTLVGHNIVGFDNPFFRNFFESMDDDIDKYVKFYWDTMNIAHAAALEQENYQLGTCCHIEGIELVDAHRALEDVKANASLFIKYIKRLRGEGLERTEKKAEVRYREKFQLG